MDKSLFIKITKVLGFVLLVVMLGSLGYYFIEGYSMLDAIYMTVITLTTTGYREIQPLSVDGKIFTISLLLCGMGVITYCASTIVNYIVSIDFSVKRREKMEKKILALKGHTIVCGYGRMGEIICEKLAAEGVTFVVIEKKPELINQLQKTGYYYLEGDAACDHTLEKAAIEKAKVLVSVIDSDSDGLYLALAARSFNRDINIIVRANEPSARKRMLRAGANKVVLPFVMSGLKVADSVINPATEDFFSLTDIPGKSGERIQIGDLYVTKDSPIIGKKVSDIGDDLKDLIIVGVKKGDHSFTFRPRGYYVFELGDCLIVMGGMSSQKDAQKKFKLSLVTEYGQFDEAS